MNYKERGIIKWQPFQSLETFFLKIKKLEDNELINDVDEQFFLKLIAKYQHEPFEFFDDSYLCIDVKSFYASCEIISRNLDVYKTKLCVVGDVNNTGSIIMSNSHALKNKYQVSNVMRYFELIEVLKKHNDQDTIIANAQMEKFVNYSVNLTKSLLQLVSKEDVYHYSIDEFFIHYKPYQNMYGVNHVAFSLALKEYILIKTGFPLVIGIGKNMVSAKFALDIYAKKNKKRC